MGERRWKRWIERIWWCVELEVGLGGFCSNFFLFFFSPVINLFFFLIHLFFSIMLVCFDCENLHSIHACKHLKTDSK